MNTYQLIRLAVMFSSVVAVGGCSHSPTQQELLDMQLQNIKVQLDCVQIDLAIYRMRYCHDLAEKYGDYDRFCQR